LTDTRADNVKDVGPNDPPLESDTPKNVETESDTPKKVETETVSYEIDTCHTIELSPSDVCLGGKDTDTTAGVSKLDDVDSDNVFGSGGNAERNVNMSAMTDNDRRKLNEYDDCISITSDAGFASSILNETSLMDDPFMALGQTLSAGGVDLDSISITPSFLELSNSSAHFETEKKKEDVSGAEQFEDGAVIVSTGDIGLVSTCETSETSDATIAKEPQATSD